MQACLLKYMKRSLSLQASLSVEVCEAIIITTNASLSVEVYEGIIIITYANLSVISRSLRNRGHYTGWRDFVLCYRKIHTNLNCTNAKTTVKKSKTSPACSLKSTTKQQKNGV